MSQQHVEEQHFRWYVAMSRLLPGVGPADADLAPEGVDLLTLETLMPAALAAVEPDLPAALLACMAALERGWKHVGMRNVSAKHAPLTHCHNFKSIYLKSKSNYNPVDRLCGFLVLKLQIDIYKLQNVEDTLLVLGV